MSACIARGLVLLTAAALAAWATPAFDIASQVSQASYQAYLDSLYTWDLQNRGWGAQHDLARTRIQQDFLDIGLSTALEPFVWSGNTYYNVVATQPGYHSDRIWLIGAHYDSANNPGADDDASGVAGILEAARILAQYEFQDTIRYVAFDREEQGLWGSTRYAQAHAGDNILGMISLDMIAYCGEVPEPHTCSDTAWVGDADWRNTSWIEQELLRAVRVYGLLDGVSPAEALSGSDHDPFRSRGFQAALLIEPNPRSNPNYHHPTDSINTPDYINYGYGTAMTRSAVGFLAEHTDIPEPAAWLIVLTGLAALAWRRSRR